MYTFGNWKFTHVSASAVEVRYEPDPALSLTINGANFNDLISALLIINPEQNPVFVSVSQIAAIFGVYIDTPANWFKRGLVPGATTIIELGRSVRNVCPLAALEYITTTSNPPDYTKANVPTAKEHSPYDGPVALGVWGLSKDASHVHIFSERLGVNVAIPFKELNAFIVGLFVANPGDNPELLSVGGVRQALGESLSDPAVVSRIKRGYVPGMVMFVDTALSVGGYRVAVPPQAIPLARKPQRGNPNLFKA